MKRIVLLSLLCGLCADCTPAQVAQTQGDVGQVIDLTNAVCSLAPESPIGQPYVTVICTLVEGTEQLVSIVIGVAGTLEPDGGVAASNASAVARVPVRQIQFSLPAATASKFLASHARRAK